MIRWLAFVACIWAGQSQALSCVEPSVKRGFTAAQSSEDRYMAVLGKLTFDQSKLPVMNAGPLAPALHSVTIDARLTGSSLTKTGFTRRYDRDVALEVVCLAGAFCASPSPNLNVLTFVLVENKKHRVVAEPCSNWLFEEPSQEDVRKVVQCFKNGSCAAAN